MRPIFKKLVISFRSQLSRRIVFYVFVSVIVIEAIILIPSYMRREKELFQQLRAVTSARLEAVMHATRTAADDDALLEQVSRLLDAEDILGGVLYHADGKMVGNFGEMPEMRFQRSDGSAAANLISADNRRYDSLWPAGALNGTHVLILRQDAGSVRRELYAFTFRIAGLVVIISIFVTAGAWIALFPIVVTPVLRLREDLEAAGNAIGNDRATPQFHSAAIQRKDELGEVIATFTQMYRQIRQAIEDRKVAEAALQKSFLQVEAISKTLNQELERGRQMQANFLPARLPDRPGWDFAAFFKPARQVSGDFYDAFDLPDGSVGLVIADVCDKGVGAALFMALFRSLIRIFSGQTALNGLKCQYTDVPADGDGKGSPAHGITTGTLNAIQLTNDYIVKNHGDLAMFATLFFGVLDPFNGELVYVNGGHDPLFLIAPSGKVREILGPTGPAVGVQLDINLRVRQTRLDPDDILFGYTDGVTEARSEDGTLYGEKKLLAILKQGAASADDLMEDLATDVGKHTGEAEQFDDITMLAVKRLPA